LHAIYREMILNSIRLTMCVLALGAVSMTVAAGALADEWPLVPGSYWEVTTIHIKDGGEPKYATWLASEWEKNLEFS